MKVIIAGSRSITDIDILWRAMSQAPLSFAADRIAQGKPLALEIVNGGAAGVDYLGEKWADAHGIPVRSFIANWKKYGKAAGPIRNRVMAEYADAAVIVWDGVSRGTQNMIDEMERAGKPYDLVNVSEWDEAGDG